MFVRGDAARLPLRDRSCDLVIGSPPYIKQRTYYEDGVDLGIARDTREWVEWMLRVTAECLRVSKGLVIWVCAGPTKERCYLPGPEGLLWEWWNRGGHCYRPVIWHRHGISGSGQDEWFRCDTENCLAFKRPGSLPWADNTANGQPPKWAPGGEMSHRLSDGSRTNQWGGNATSGNSRKANGERQRPGRPSHVVTTKVATNRREDGDRKAEIYVPPAIANPGNFLSSEPVSFHFVEVLHAYHRITGDGSGTILRDMQEAARQETVSRWFLGILVRVHAEEVLQSCLQGDRFLPPRRPSMWRSPSSRSEDCPSQETEDSLRGLRDDVEIGGPSQGRGCDEQRGFQPGSSLPEMSSEEAQDSELFGSRVRQAILESELLQSALPKIQEVWRSFGEVLGKRAPSASPGLIHTSVGGGHMGHSLSCLNEAPYPVDVPRWFVASHCPPGGLVLDPFSGSASTGQAALETGRRYVGLDLRMSQCRLGRRRLRTVTPGFVFREEGGPCAT